MANVKITDLSPGSALGGTELFESVQSAASVKITAAQIKTFANGSVTISGGTISSVTISNSTGTSLTINNSTIASSVINNSTGSSLSLTNSSFVSGTITNSTGSSLSITNSTISSSTITNATATFNSVTISNGTIGSVTLSNSTANSLVLNNCSITNSSGRSLSITNSSILSSTITSVTGVSLAITNSTLSSSTITNTTGSFNSITITAGTVPFNTITNRAYAEFASTADQTAVSANVAYAALFDTASSFNTGITIASSTNITVAAAGVYVITASIQFFNSDAADNDATFWFTKNGGNIANSASKVTVPKTGDGGQLMSQITTIQQLAASDYVQLIWLVESTQVRLDYTAGTVSIPAIPSVIFNIQRIG